MFYLCFSKPPSSPKAQMSDLQGMLPKPDSGEELACDCLPPRDGVLWFNHLIVKSWCLEGSRSFSVLSCCPLLTPAALFLVTSKWVAVGPLLSPESYPAWSGQAAQIMHASNSSDRGLQAQPCLLLLQLALHYIHFNAVDRSFFSFCKQTFDWNTVK